MSLGAPSLLDHRLDRPIELRPGARVEGASGRALRRVAGAGVAALAGRGRGRGRGLIRGLRLVDERLAGEVWRGHLVELDGPGAWRVEDVAVEGAPHGGVYVGADVDVEVVGLRGSGCGYGEFVVVGGGCRVLVEAADVARLHDELDHASPPSHRVYRDSRCDHLSVRTRPNAGTVLIERVTVASLVQLHHPVECVAVGCDWSTASVEVVNPQRVVLTGCRVGSGLVRLQTAWMSPERWTDPQLVTLTACTLGATLTVRGVGVVELDDCTGPPAPVPWLQVDTTEVSALGHQVDVRQGGQTVAVLTAVGQTWRPS